MKKKYFVRPGLLFFGFFSLMFFGHGFCVDQVMADESGSSTISYYTCPMHHQIHSDHPGNCPICGMRLVPVYRDVSGGQEIEGMQTPKKTGVWPAIRQVLEKRQSATISEERQRMIGITTEPVVKKAAIHEIRTLGRVAFDPELVVAQREFVEKIFI